MSEFAPSQKGGCLRWIIAAVVIVFLLPLLVPSYGQFSPLEVPFHLVIGWIPHAWRSFPILATQWRALALPLCCLFIALVLFHRFALWWLREKAPAVKWRPRHTITTVGVLLGISGAAIAMSGITHQSAWLRSEPWLETNGIKSERSLAVNNGKQLMLAIYAFHEDHGRYPESIQELEQSMEPAFARRFFRTEPKRGVLPEPFILLKPGATEQALNDEPLLLSPYLPYSDCYAVGYGDSSVRLIKPKELETILTSGMR